MVVISNWAGEYTFLRNDFPVDVTTAGGTTYPSVEHAFQAAKIDYAELDPLEAEKFKVQIKEAQSAREAKRIGNQVQLDSGYWDSHRLPIMKDLVHRKFTQNDGLGHALLRTDGHEIVMKYRDSFWGDGGDGSGKDHLGQILMEVRDDLGQNKAGWINPDGTVKWDGRRKVKPVPPVSAPKDDPPPYASVSMRQKPAIATTNPDIPLPASSKDPADPVYSPDWLNSNKTLPDLRLPNDRSSTASAEGDENLTTSEGYKDALGKICGDIDDL